MPSVEEVLGQAERALKASTAIEHPHRGKERADAEELLSFVLGRDLDSDEQMAPLPLARFNDLLSRRVAGEPTAYLTGRTDFRGLTLRVAPGAFIPRQSSEFMAEQAIRRLRGRHDPLHLDLATGIGPVALAVAAALPKARVFGVDVAAKPLSLARRNARRLGVTNVEFLKGDLFSPLPERLLGSMDVITVHPPYVGTKELKDLSWEIVHFEPEESLTDYSPAGDRILKEVMRESPRWLRRGGWLLVEVSPDRSRSVATMLRRGGFFDVRSTKGVVDVSRVVVGRNR